MSRSDATGSEEAIARARDHSPFLRDAMAIRPEVATAFLESGAEAAAKIANTIAELYIDNSSASKSEADTKASMALQVQTEELRKRLIAALAEAEKFRAENGLVSTGQQGLVGDQAGRTQIARLNPARVPPCSRSC